MTEAVQALTLKIPAKPEYVRIVRLMMSGLANRLNFSAEDVEDLKVAVTEACTHAVERKKSREIRVCCEITSHSLRICVCNCGDDFEDFDQPKIFLLRALMDEVNYEITSSNSSFLSMTKHFTQS